MARILGRIWDAILEGFIYAADAQCYTGVLMRTEQPASVVYKYIQFDLYDTKPKTSCYLVTNVKSAALLGRIKWHGAWRQYCFYPEPDTIFSVGCMKDINDFIGKLSGEP